MPMKRVGVGQRAVDVEQQRFPYFFRHMSGFPQPTYLSRLTSNSAMDPSHRFDRVPATSAVAPDSEVGRRNHDFRSSPRSRSDRRIRSRRRVAAYDGARDSLRAVLQCIRHLYAPARQMSEISCQSHLEAAVSLNSSTLPHVLSVTAKTS